MLGREGKLRNVYFTWTKALLRMVCCAAEQRTLRVIQLLPLDASNASLSWTVIFFHVFMAFSKDTKEPIPYKTNSGVTNCTKGTVTVNPKNPHKPAAGMVTGINAPKATAEEP